MISQPDFTNPTSLTWDLMHHSFRSTAFAAKGTTVYRQRRRSIPYEHEWCKEPGMSEACDGSICSTLHPFWEVLRGLSPRCSRRGSQNFSPPGENAEGFGTQKSRYQSRILTTKTNNEAVTAS